MNRDTLSDVLYAVRLKGAIFFSIHASYPWVVESPRSALLAPHVMPGAQHVIAYHVVASGGCYAGLPGETLSELESGDIIVFPQGDSHVLSSARNMRGDNGQAAIELAERATRLPLIVRMGGGAAETTHLVCGYLGCDARPFNPLLVHLPRVIHVRRRDGDGVLQAFVQLALKESDAPAAGSDCVLARLSELMFVDVVRRHLAALPPGETGWLAGLRDEAVGRCLGKLHEQPARGWTLEDLARETGQSRSVLVERFSLFVGVAPMQYLAQWRMQLATGLLASSSMAMAEIAAEVGYGSEPAFSRAFKREIGIAPAQFRKGLRGAGSDR
jgi:AraC-like DNA-binding protein